MADRTGRPHVLSMLEALIVNLLAPNLRVGSSTLFGPVGVGKFLGLDSRLNRGAVLSATTACTELRCTIIT